MLSATLWSARAHAVSAVRLEYSKFNNDLEIITKNENQTAEIKHEARFLTNKHKELENALTIFWNDILLRINKTSETIQRINTDLFVVVELLTLLENFIQSLRIKFDVYEEEAKKLVKGDNYRDYNKRTKRISTKLSFFESTSDNVVLEEKDKFRVEVYIPIIDQLCTELIRRSKEYKIIFDRF